MDDDATAGQAGISAPEVQAHLDSRLSRIDEEMARAMADYQDARGRLADQHAKMAGQAEKEEAALARQRVPLERTVFEGKPPPSGFSEKLAAYQEAVAQAGKSCLARRMAFGANQKPGEVPTGAPLGTPPPAASPSAPSSRPSRPSS